MKTIAFLATILLSTLAIADISIPRTPVGNPNSGNYRIPRMPSTGSPREIGIPRGELEQLLAQQLARVTGLIKDDHRYVKALAQCAQKDVEVSQYFKEVIDYLNSIEFKSQSKDKKKEELTMARMQIKMACAQQIHKFGIEP